MNDEILSLERLSNSLQVLTVGRLKLYYSYKTVVAYETDSKKVVCENVWSKTTGKHLNMIDPIHETRQREDVFKRTLAHTLERYGVNKKLGTI